MRVIPVNVARSALQFLAAPKAAALLALAMGLYWSAIYVAARAENGPFARPEATSSDPAFAIYAINLTDTGWVVGRAVPCHFANYMVTRLDAPARVEWLAAPIRREREVQVDWSPGAGDSWSSRRSTIRSTGSEIERRQALGALASWLESPVGGNEPASAHFLRDHPDGRSSESIPSGYAHTGVLGGMAALLMISLAHTPLRLARTWRTLRRQSALARNRCPACGYPAQGLRVPVCPECGDLQVTPSPAAISPAA